MTTAPTRRADGDGEATAVDAGAARWSRPRPRPWPGRARRPRSARPSRRARPGAAADIDAEQDEDEELDEEVAAPPSAPRGRARRRSARSGTPSSGRPRRPSSASLAPLAADDEDFDEPEIPEYLIAEQRRGRRQPRRPWWRRRWTAVAPAAAVSAYQSAMERERYGGGGGGGGINRYPDVSGRDRQPASHAAPSDRSDSRAARRSDRRATGRAASAPRSSSEPWSEVPPELEAMLRAQVAGKPAPAPTGSRDVTEAADGRGRTAEPRSSRRRPRRSDGRLARRPRPHRPCDRRHDGRHVRRGSAGRPKPSARTTRKPAASAERSARGRRRPTARPMHQAAPKQARDPQAGDREPRPTERRRPPMPRPSPGRAEAAGDAQGDDGRARLSPADVDGPGPEATRPPSPRSGRWSGAARRTRSCSSDRPGVGKTTLARDLAAGLLCTADDVAARPCGACRACRLVARRRPPGRPSPRPGGPGRQVVIGGPGGKLRGVRDLLVRAGAAARGGRRTGSRIIESASADERGRPGRAAQDARGAAGRRDASILCADDEEPLLPTIRSRCARLRLGPVADPRDRGDPRPRRALPTPPLAARLARIADGRPGLAMAWAPRPRGAPVRDELGAGPARPPRRAARPSRLAAVRAAAGAGEPPRGRRRAAAATRARDRRRPRRDGGGRGPPRPRRRHRRSPTPWTAEEPATAPTRTDEETDAGVGTTDAGRRTASRSRGPHRAAGPTSPATSPCAGVGLPGSVRDLGLLDETAAAAGRARSRRARRVPRPARARAACCSRRTSRPELRPRRPRPGLATPPRGRGLTERPVVASDPTPARVPRPRAPRGDRRRARPGRRVPLSTSCDRAIDLGLTGWVANEPDGTVRAWPRDRATRSSASWRRCEAGPPAAIVERVVVAWRPATGTLGPFSVRSGGHRGD